MQETTVKNKNGLNKGISQDLDALFEAGAHIGHTKARRHPKMSKYVFGVRNNVEIFNLQATESKLHEAEAFMKELGRQKKLVLFAGTKPAARKFIDAVANKIGMPYVTERWLGGILTNFKAIEGRLTHWKQLEQEVAEGGLEKYVKKERVMKLNELRKLIRMFGGLRTLSAIPEALVVVDPREETTAVSEARKKGLSIIAILNNDCNPDGILYPIPANDDSVKVIDMILERLVSAYEQGKKEGIQAATA